MADKENVKKALDICKTGRCIDELGNSCPYSRVKRCSFVVVEDALELLKEHDEQKRKWLRNIADNQLANAPTETMNASKQIYYRGIWYGLQMAYDILTEET